MFDDSSTCAAGVRKSARGREETYDLGFATTHVGQPAALRLGCCELRFEFVERQRTDRNRHQFLRINLADEISFADLFDLVFQRAQPRRQIESNANGSSRKFVGFCFELFERGAKAIRFRIAHGGFDKRSHSVDRHRLDESFFDTIGDGWHSHGMPALQFAKLLDVEFGFSCNAFVEAFTPTQRRLIEAHSHEDFVGPHDRFQIPSDAFVSSPQTQEIEERVDQFAAIALCRCAVVVLVFRVVIKQRFEDQRDPTRGFVDLDLANFEIAKKLGVFQQVITIGHGSFQP